MSLHGRIYVEKSLTLDKQRERNLQKHYKNLESIHTGKTTVMHMKDVTRSTEEQLKQKEKIRVINNEFKENELKRAIFKENRKLLVKLVDISRGKMVGIDNGTSHDQNQELNNYIKKTLHGITTTPSLNRSASGIRLRHNSSEQKTHPQENLSASKEKQALHENLRKEQARLIELENSKIAKKLMNVQGTININRNNLESSFSRHQRAKAILCKLPIVDMKQNCFSGGAAANNRGEAFTTRANPNYSQERHSPRASTRRHRPNKVNRSLMESNSKKQLSMALQSYDSVLDQSRERHNIGQFSTHQAGTSGTRGINRRRLKQHITVRDSVVPKQAGQLPSITSPLGNIQTVNQSQLSNDTLQNIQNDSKIDNDASILVDEQASNEPKIASPVGAEIYHPYTNVSSSLPAINQTPSIQQVMSTHNKKGHFKKRHHHRSSFGNQQAALINSQSLNPSYLNRIYVPFEDRAQTNRRSVAHNPVTQTSQVSLPSNPLVSPPARAGMVSVNDRNGRYAQSPISNILMKKQLRKGRKKRTQSSKPRKVVQGGEDLQNIINTMTKDKSKSNLISPDAARNSSIALNSSIEAPPTKIEQPQEEKADQQSNQSFPVETTDVEGKEGVTARPSDQENRRQSQEIDPAAHAMGPTKRKRSRRAKHVPHAKPDFVLN